MLLVADICITKLCLNITSLTKTMFKKCGCFSHITLHYVVHHLHVQNLEDHEVKVQAVSLKKHRKCTYCYFWCMKKHIVITNINKKKFHRIASPFMTWESRERLSSHYIPSRYRYFKNTFLLQYRGILYLLPLPLIEHNTDGRTIMLGMVHCPRYIWYT
jgi:hypothetical protein